MALGANILGAENQRRLQSRIAKILKFRPSAFQIKEPDRVLAKAGVPATNTAADSPGRAFVFIVDTTNGRVYWCNSWTDVNTFVIVRLDS